MQGEREGGGRFEKGGVGGGRTLAPGSCPPSPGLAPCATLISISLQLFRYSAVTPKRPDAICLIALEGLSPFSRSWNLAESSPPSPESDFAPIRFIAIDSVSCASGLSAPSEMPGDTSRLRIRVMDSTSSSFTASRPVLKSIRSRRLTGPWPPTSAEYFFQLS